MRRIRKEQNTGDSAHIKSKNARRKILNKLWGRVKERPESLYPFVPL
jgi:hypothetical protein